MHGTEHAALRQTQSHAKDVIRFMYNTIFTLNHGTWFIALIRLQGDAQNMIM